METAAAILVQALFASSDELRRQLNMAVDPTTTNPQAAATFLKPWYQAVLMMVKSAEHFDQSATSHPAGF
ncbi:MAG TPA: hypothetical protein VNE63_15325 [Candidatus Acidoferrales bacterium]|nr:hypothetical protein [Candidatus Acidoferrales bacterium]